MLSRAPQHSFPSIDASYAQRLQCARQWRGFLGALGDEFTSALPAQELAALMARIGMRFAAQHRLGACQTVPELQEAMNGVWGALDWGTVELTQTPGGMEVHHRFSPLAAAFGAAQADWAAGFLQGAYQHWFDAAGAGGLSVQLSSAMDALGSAHLRLVTA